MRVLAIDPGYDRVGFAILERTSTARTPVIYSSCLLTSRKDTFAKRLDSIAQEMERLIQEFKPTHCALEKLYFTKNQKTAMGVAEVRGMLTYLAQKHGLVLSEYTPLQVKVAVTGDGKSSKERVAFMVRKLSEIPTRVRYDDEYDAIAIALTCLASERI